MNVNKDKNPKEENQTQDTHVDEEHKRPEIQGKDVDLELTATTRDNNSILYKVTTFLSLGLSVLALFYTMAVMEQVNKMGPIKYRINALEENSVSFRTEINGKLSSIGRELNSIKSTVEKTQRLTTILELKNALVSVQEESLVGESPEAKAKSNQVITSIKSFLKNLSMAKKKTPEGTIKVKEEPEKAAIKN